MSPTLELGRFALDAKLSAEHCFLSNLRGLGPNQRSTSTIESLALLYCSIRCSKALWKSSSKGAGFSAGETADPGPLVCVAVGACVSPRTWGTSSVKGTPLTDTLNVERNLPLRILARITLPDGKACFVGSHGLQFGWFVVRSVHSVNARGAVTS